MVKEKKMWKEWKIFEMIFARKSEKRKFSFANRHEAVMFDENRESLNTLFSSIGHKTKLWQ